MKKLDLNRRMYADAETGEPGSRSVGIGAGTDGAVDEWDDEIDPTLEDAYWRENYTSRPYVTEGDAYDPYAAGYRTGYQNFSRYRGKRFDEVEPELRKDYESRAEKGAITWEKAKAAARDAWQRLEDYLPGDSDRDGH